MFEGLIKNQRAIVLEIEVEDCIHILFLFRAREKYMPFYEERDKNADFVLFIMRTKFFLSSFSLSVMKNIFIKGERFMGKLEKDFQAKLIKEIKTIFPGCIVMKNDPNYIQGIPDLIVLFEDRWAALEVKKSERASHRPLQNHYVNKMDEMSFAAFIYPENKEEVLYELQQTFFTRR